ncbi:hypothetical protein [Aeoliella sp. SH292]|uniref:hypothetical protein n=1 Tax=Aeoliella sp. SH292 TaxID=3454464 RepID=UPI003F9B7D58
MSDRDFESAPDLSREFDEADSIEIPDIAYDFDAASWEPTEEPDFPKPSEKHLTLDYTPGGYLEQDVHSELDERARREIRYQQQAQQEVGPEYQSMSDEWDDVAKREFEEWQRQDQADYLPEEEEELDEHDWNGPIGRQQDRGHDCEHER